VASTLSDPPWHSDLRKMLVTQQPKVVIVNDRMQRGYRYMLTARAGRNFDPQFRPGLTPKAMLALGVFCGKYMTDCHEEFPASWFARAKLSPSSRDCSLNYFGVDASQSLSIWRRNGWLHPDDPRGWFQWYCRFTQSARLSIAFTSNASFRSISCAPLPMEPARPSFARDRLMERSRADATLPC
jgi:hypothetical protein